MDLRVTDLQNMLSVSRKTLYRWIQAKKIPAYRISGQYRFRRDEIDRWMGRSRVAAAAGEPPAETGRVEPLADLLRRGGIHFRTEGRSISEAIEGALAATPLPAGVDPAEVLEAILEREQLMSTGVGRGIAVPHPRQPKLSRPEDERVSLCFLEHPVDFRAPDGLAVSALFVVLGCSLKGQLRLLSQIASLCRDDGFMQLLERQASRSDILDHVESHGGGPR